MRAETMNINTAGKAHELSLLQYSLLLVLVLLALFGKALLPGETLASNDGPLGAMVARHNQVIPTMTGYWQDLNWLGTQFPTIPPSITTVIRLLLRFLAQMSGLHPYPVLASKLYYPITLYILGICAWFCFRQWKLRPLSCALGGLAAVLSSHFFSTACWG